MCNLVPTAVDLDDDINDDDVGYAGSDIKSDATNPDSFTLLFFETMNICRSIVISCTSIIKRSY